jgi:primosomal protein N' (replication factor Y)
MFHGQSLGREDTLFRNIVEKVTVALTTLTTLLISASPQKIECSLIEFVEFVLRNVVYSGKLKPFQGESMGQKVHHRLVYPKAASKGLEKSFSLSSFMVKSFMDLIDVVFPLALGPLTYRWSLDPSRICPGTLVRAEVKKSVRYGVVIGKAAYPPSGSIKEIHDIVFDKPIISGSLVKLLKWMAAYYLVPEGVVLKSMAIMEYCETTATRPYKQTRASQFPAMDMKLPPSASSIVSPIRDSLARDEYKTILIHTPTSLHEISYLLEIVRETRNVIILVPEITEIARLFPLLKKRFGQRVCILHGNLSKGQRKASIQRILSSESDIVLGTRLAVFAPLQSVSLISVLHEHSDAYKNLEGVRYHARDIAVMRGYLEKSLVVLSSATPSLESFYNTVKGKYTLMRSTEEIRRPRVEIINMKTAKKVTPYLSKRTVQAAAACIRDKRNALFFVNRKGYSMIQCADCNTIQSCHECKIPLVYYKEKKVLKCHYCNYTKPATDKCRTCQGSRLEMVGAGTQRIKTDLKRYLDIEPLRLDKDTIREGRVKPRGTGLSEGEEIIVGTKAVMGTLRQRDSYRLCVLLHPDMTLHLPDFRSSELLFQEIFALSECLTPDGLMIVQTRMPEHPVFSYIKKFNVSGLMREELPSRKSLSYPPFSRIVTITVSSRSDINSAIMDALKPSGERIEIIGPLDVSQKVTRAWKVILKSSAKEQLRLYAGAILDRLKDQKGLRVIVDVDPISI